MNKHNNKIKEWILVKYSKEVIINMFNQEINIIQNVPIYMENIEYYELYMNNNIEFGIFSTIFNDVYKKRKKKKDINEIIFFILHYIKIIIPKFKINTIKYKKTKQR